MDSFNLDGKGNWYTYIRAIGSNFSMVRPIANWHVKHTNTGEQWWI